MEPTDADYLAQWRDGDQEAGNMLVRRHFATVFRFFRGKIAGGVDDLTQRTFLACVESSSRFRGDGSFRAFVLGIARKVLLVHLRKQYRHERVFDPEALSIHQALDPTGGSVTGKLVGRENERLLLAALARIPLDFQIAVELFYWEEMPLKDIAEVLEIAPGTVKSRLGRARVMLRQQIELLAASPAIAEQTVSGLDHWARSLKRRYLEDEP